MNEPPSHEAQLLLKPEQAAKILAVGRTQVYALIANGDLESVQIGRLRRVPYVACERYVESLQASAGQPQRLSRGACASKEASVVAGRLLEEDAPLTAARQASLPDGARLRNGVRP